MFRHRALLVVPLLALLRLTACSSSDPEEITVLAAASLTETFEALEAEFEETHDGVDVKLSFGSSTTLAEQAIQRAPGDVLATADQESMQAAQAGGALAADPSQFAANRLVIVVPADNPANIGGVTDLADTTWVRCDDEVPCGRLAVSLLDANQVTAEPASREVDVKAALAKVIDNEADAGLVYATDATAAGNKVEMIEISGAESELNPYLIAPLEQTKNADLARKWIDFVNSEAGRKILQDAGLDKP